MGKTLERVEQSDGSFKWEMVEFQPQLTEKKAVKKTAKKKTTTTEE